MADPLHRARRHLPRRARRTRFFMDRFADAFRAELDAFTEVVAGTRPSPCTVADAVEVGWIAEAADLSLRQHRPVRMDELRPARPSLRTQPPCRPDRRLLDLGRRRRPVPRTARPARSTSASGSRAVAEAGYTGFGLTREDLVVARDSIGLSAVAACLREHGITTVQLERLTDWWATRRASARARTGPGPTSSRPAPCSASTTSRSARTTRAPRSSTTSSARRSTRWPTDAAQVGVKIGFENTPFSYRIRTTEEAIELVTDVANPNGGRRARHLARLPRRHATTA